MEFDAQNPPPGTASPRPAVESGPGIRWVRGVGKLGRTSRVLLFDDANEKAFGLLKRKSVVFSTASNTPVNMWFQPSGQDLVTPLHSAPTTQATKPCEDLVLHELLLFPLLFLETGPRIL